ncbi:SDR family NAD(P)-dependent oxidoreductase [Engelhardtia mirabilis]|uniref:3-oxoacyl-[acyl-carrier-protein] reductase FabG n=1 Tax=Engelhardtia mirabilis TaxID=2528011 RepID=A0A518BHA0_9BACT|nr:3-oxoacyl-[acyl-carrier-protein] reductase FabG [Planctomycetes bacterium Pla133]QDV00687.1 3-oxoacyl-[acyl-carrier-protein] reductase FabG [Planctomycetes bacterium Pla86]
MTNKIAVITGGSRGLGRSTALHLADQGVGVVPTYLENAEAAAEVVGQIESRGGRAAALQLDTSDTAGFEAAARELSRTLERQWSRRTFDFLVNNAGFGVHKPFAETTEAEFDQLMNVHLKGVFFLTQRLLPLIADGGRIVNLSSGLTRFALPGYAAYGAMKGAVEVLTRYLAKELGPRGITVNVVAPGAIETDFGGGVVRDDPELNRFIAANTALGRVGLPDDVGGAIASLLLGGNQWVTGQRIEVSGGQNL